MRTLLQAYRRAGGVESSGAPALLVHSQGAGTKLLNDMGRAARVDAAVDGVPARVLPVDVWHTASVGLDLWLAAFAYGAAEVCVLLTDEEAPDYRHALQDQAAIANALMEGWGYAGGRVRLIEAREPAALDAALQTRAAPALAQAASFAVQADKRATLELAIDHLLAHAPSRAEAIALPPAGSPFGNVLVNTDTCTMCLACVGACPESALADNPDRPQLRFIEKNCVQCGLCATTCPEDAIRLEPRLLLADGGKARAQARVLNEAEPFCCVRCGKPFGTLRAIELMIAKLGSHAMFQGVAAARLKMCGDCRIIDIHTNPDEVRIDQL
jgi:ferredoxin